MNTYHTTCYEICKVTRRIKADSILEAAELAENGVRGDFLDCEQIGEPDLSRTEVYLEED